MILSTLFHCPLIYVPSVLLSFYMFQYLPSIMAIVNVVSLLHSVISHVTITTGRRHSLPNNLVPVVTQNTMLQPVAIDNPNYINYRYGRRNSDPSVSSTVVPQALHTPGEVIYSMS